VTAATANRLLSDAEVALARIGGYLQASGVNVDANVALAAMALVQEGLGSHPGDLLDWVMHEARLRFVPPPPHLPEANPPLLRGSICYGKDL